MADAATRDRLQEERAAVVKEYESLTRDWIAGPTSDEKLQEQRGEVAERLRAGYWKLDPYVRARCYLDRTGIIGRDGRIDFYPSKGGGEPSKEAPAPATSHDDLD